MIIVHCCILKAILNVGCYIEKREKRKAKAHTPA
jgi:hypothetical protein